jgi:hypothetical protein
MRVLAAVGAKPWGLFKQRSGIITASLWAQVYGPKEAGKRTVKRRPAYTAAGIMSWRFCGLLF